VINALSWYGSVRIPFGTNQYDTVPVEIKRGTITMDQSWSPYVQVDVDCALTNVEAAKSIDPTEKEFRLALVGSQSGNATGESISRIFVTGIESRTISHEAASFNLRSNSKEADLLHETHWGDGYITPGPFTKMWDLVNYVLGRSGMHLTNISGPAQLVGVNEAFREWHPGVSAWDYISNQVREANLFLWCDELGEWWLRDARTPTNIGVVVAQGRNLIDGDDEVTVEGNYYSAVSIEYRWEENGVQKVMYGHAMGTPEGAPARFFTKTVNAKFPGHGQARAILNELIRNRNQQTLRAITDLRATPGQVITLNTPTYSGLATVTAVTFGIETDEMLITVRYA
jgi:hypothetical protein